MGNVLPQVDERIFENALVLIKEIDRALRSGTKHYRKSDGKLLLTAKEILRVLVDEKEIIFEPK